MTADLPQVDLMQAAAAMCDEAIKERMKLLARKAFKRYVVPGDKFRPESILWVRMWQGVADVVLACSETSSIGYTVPIDDFKITCPDLVPREKTSWYLAGGFMEVTDALIARDNAAAQNAFQKATNALKSSTTD